MVKFARLKPYNPTAGHVRKRYIKDGKTYDVSKGWYKVTEELAADLATVPMRDYDKSPRPILAFDIVTEKQRKAIDAKEQKEQYEKLLKDKGLPLILGMGGGVPVTDFTGNERE